MVSISKSGMAIALVALLCVSTLGGCSSCGPCGDPCDPCGPVATPVCNACGPLPAEAKPGEAWCCIQVPAQYEEVEVQVCVCPEACQREWIEPVYEEQERQVCCTPARCERIEIPAEFEERSREVMVCPARTEWVKIPCEASGLGEGEQQGDCYMLKEIPAQYRTVTERVCVKPASFEVKQLEPEYRTVKERVMVKPGEWKVNTVPARFETRKERRMVAPARWEWRRNADCEVPADAGASAEGSDGSGAAIGSVDGSAEAQLVDDLGPPSGR